jgi:DNA repair ATPase RecN
MLQKIVFQDNIFQVIRSIDVAYEGLLLELAPEYFLDKTVDDLLFFDATIQKLYKHINANQQIADYLSLLHNLYSCQRKYLSLIDAIIQRKNPMKAEFEQLLPKLQSIRNVHAQISAEIASQIQKSDKNADSREIVSSNELSELLNF